MVNCQQTLAKELHDAKYLQLFEFHPKAVRLRRLQPLFRLSTMSNVALIRHPVFDNEETVPMTKPQFDRLFGGDEHYNYDTYFNEHPATHQFKHYKALFLKSALYPSEITGVDGHFTALVKVLDAFHATPTLETRYERAKAMPSCHFWGQVKSESAAEYKDYFYNHPLILGGYVSIDSISELYNLSRSAKALSHSDALKRSALMRSIHETAYAKILSGTVAALCPLPLEFLGPPPDRAPRAPIPSVQTDTMSSSHPSCSRTETTAKMRLQLNERTDSPGSYRSKDAIDEFKPIRLF